MFYSIVGKSVSNLKDSGKAIKPELTSTVILSFGHLVATSSLSQSNYHIWQFWFTKWLKESSYLSL